MSNFSITIFLLALALPAPSQDLDLAPYARAHPDWYGPVIRTADGDTFYVRFYTDELGVRLKGIDTPETKDRRRSVQFGGPEASAFTKELLKPGTLVKMSFDGEMIDSFGRLLAYVWYWDGDSWESVQEVLLRRGLAFVYVNYPFERPLEYFGYQQEAQQAGLGLWADPGKIENRIIKTRAELEALPWVRKLMDLKNPLVQ